MAIVGDTSGVNGSAYYIWDPYFSDTTATQIPSQSTGYYYYYTSVNGNTFKLVTYSVYK